MKKENKKQYTRQNDRFSAKFHLSAEERSALQAEMRKEGWENFSGYIRNKIFGEDSMIMVNKLIENKDPEDLVLLLKNCILELATKYDYVIFRYDKDMNQLYKEEGVDLKKWTDVTNHWHSVLVTETQKTLRTINKIADVLELDKYYEMPSDKMVIDPKTASVEEMDKLAEQLRIERIALGHDGKL